MGHNVAVPRKSPKLTERPTELSNETVWVFCEEGNASKVIDPFLSYPLLNLVAGDKAKIVRRVFKVPDGIDPLFYAIETLCIDTMYIVFDIKDFDPRGIHRYGYTMVDYTKREIISTYTRNKDGVYELAWLQRQGLLLYKTDREKPREPKQFAVDPGTGFPGNDPGIWADEVEERFANSPKEIGTDPLLSFARCRDIDFKRSLKYWKEFFKTVETARDVSRLFCPQLVRLYDYESIRHLGPDIMRDLFMLPTTVIDQDGRQTFVEERLRLIRACLWPELKHHLKQCKERLLKKHFSTGVPGEEYVALLYTERYDPRVHQVQ